ncbi:MAG TPA: hypothetical protein VGH05_03890 [Buttiauxella sp.]|jgi:hypothetical protein
MKVNKSCRKNITWKVKFWVMPVLYLLAWGKNAYALASPQAMTIGISVFLLMNLCIFCLLFKSQFNQVKNSAVNALFIEKVISKKTLLSFLVWMPLIVIGALFDEISFMVLSTIAMWFSVFMFLFSTSKEFNIIPPDIACDDEFENQRKHNAFTDEERKVGINPATGLPLVTGSSDASGSSYGTSNFNSN